MSKLGAAAARKRRAAEAALKLVTPPAWQSEHHTAPLTLDASAIPSANRPVFGRTLPRPTIHRWHPDRFAEPQWVQIEAALLDAENGATERLVDLFVRMVASDGHLFSLRGSRIGLVSGAEWKVEPNPRAKPGTPEYDLAKRAADDCSEMLEGLGNIERTFADILDAIFVGWSVQEIIWGLRGSDVAVEELVWIHPRRFRFDRDFNIFLWDSGGEWAELDRNKFVVHIPRSIPTYPPLSGTLNACLRPWFAKLWSRRYHLNGAEVSGNPRLLGKYPQAADDSTKEALYAAMASLAADGVGAISTDAELDVLDVKARGDDSVWSALSKQSDAENSKAVWGSTLNVEVGDTGGNRSLGESQGDITIGPRAELDQRGMWSTIERDLFAPFLRFNAHKYGGRMPPIPRGTSIVWEPPVEIDAIALRYGKVTVDQLRMSRGLPPKGSEGGGDEEVRFEDASAQVGAPVAGPQAPERTATPAPGAEPAAVPTADVADAALNGAQITSLQGIVQAVSDGSLDVEAARALIESGFPTLREDLVTRMLDGALRTKPPPGGAGEAAPFPQQRPLTRSPWTRAAAIAGQAATETCSPSPTTTSGTER